MGLGLLRGRGVWGWGFYGGVMHGAVSVLGEEAWGVCHLGASVELFLGACAYGGV